MHTGSLRALAALLLTGCLANGVSDGASSSGAGSAKAKPSKTAQTADVPTGGASPSGDQGTPAAGATDEAPEAPCVSSPKIYGTMHVWECTPSGMEGKTDQPAGLVVALHGYTQGVVQQSSPSQSWGFKPTTEWAKLAAKHRFYVIFPDKGTSAFQWYAFFGTTGIGRNDLEPSSIAQMVKDMQATHNIDPDKIFVNGLSAGAYMAVVMLATYPDLFAGGSTFAGGAYGCSTQCAALGKKGKGWTWAGNHGAQLVTSAFPTVWANPGARKPRLMIFQGGADGAVTPENLADLTQQWTGALGIAGQGTPGDLKGHAYTEYAKDGQVMVATVLMDGIGHGTPVDPGTADDQGGWDPEPSKTMVDDANAVQDWTNSAGIYGPYYSARFFGLVN